MLTKFYTEPVRVRECGIGTPRHPEVTVAIGLSAMRALKWFQESDRREPHLRPAAEELDKLPEEQILRARWRENRYR